MKKSFKTIICMFLIALMACFSLNGCGGKKTEKTGNNANEKTASTDPYHYKVYYTSNDVMPWYDNKKDVVTPYVENKFNMHIDEVVWTANQTNRIDTLIATDSLPEVIIIDPNFLMDLISKGVVMDLTDLIPQYMPNYWNKYMKDKDKGLSKVDGKMYYVYKTSARNATAQDELNDMYSQGGGHAPMIREDLLAKCGYKFTPLKEVEAKCKAENRVPTEEEMSITPAVKTPEDFMQLLEKIKSLNIKVNNLPLIPWSGTWSLFHFGSMFDFGHWKWDTTTKSSDGYLGAPGAKDYYKFINSAYQQGLLDKDFIIQKDEELIQKVASGRVGTFMTDIGDINTVQESLYKIDPSYTIRPIPWPETENHGYFDCYTPAWLVACINKDVPKDKAIRLLQMWDWMYSDEGYDTLVWGPKDAGLYEEKDGKKVLKDSKMLEAYKTKKAGVGGPDEYGLNSMAPLTNADLWSKIANCSGGPCDAGTKSINRSYPVEVNVFSKFQQFCQGDHVCRDAQASYGVGEIVGKTGNYYWMDFQKNDLPKLLVAKSDTEFDSAWDNTMKSFKSTAEYDKAKEAMDKWFKEAGNN